MRITAIYRAYTMPARLFSGKLQPSFKETRHFDTFEKSETKQRRDLTEEELEILKTTPNGTLILRNQNGELANFIDLMDLEAGPKNAIALAKSNEDTLKYKKLSIVNEEGNTVITSRDIGSMTLTKRLSPDEIMLIISAKHPRLTASVIQTFIDLKNTGNLEDKDALRLACSSILSEKFFDTTTKKEDGKTTLKDKDGKYNIVLKRPLTAPEALSLLKTDNKKIQTYIELVDMGISSDIALQIVRIDARTKRFFSLITPNDEGKLVLENKNGKKTELQRPLTIEEALIAMKEGYNNQKLEEQLTLAGHIFHTKRHS